MSSAADRQRREVLGGLLSAGVLAVAGGLPAARAGAAATPAPAQPRRGGRIRVASISSSTADTLDPAKGALSTDYARHYMLYSGLTQFDGALVARPALAERIETRDRKSWHLRLRSGVQFHDGRPLRAADAAWSLLRHKDPTTGSKMQAIAAQFADARATGPLDLQIDLQAPNADLPAILADAHFLVLAEGTSDFRTANGTGPYRLQEFSPGLRTVAVRNANWWKPGPWLEEIELIGIPDEPARVNALLSGDVHLVNGLNPRSTRRLAASPAHAVQVTKSGLYTELIMRQDMAPTRNPDFTLAMKYLFDRELINRALFRNFGTIANDQPIPPGHPYYYAGLPQRPYDPERARFLLQRAGLLGIRLPVYASPAAEGSVDMASVLQESAARIGLRLAVNRVPADGYWSTHWMKHPLGFGNTNPRPTADLMFSTLFKSDAPWNVSGWKDERFDALLLAARSEGDEDRRREMYAEMQMRVHAHCGVAIPVFISLIDGYDRRLRGFGSIPIGGLMGYSFAEHVWWQA